MIGDAMIMETYILDAPVSKRISEVIKRFSHITDDRERIKMICENITEEEKEQVRREAGYAYKKFLKEVDLQLQEKYSHLYKDGREPTFQELAKAIIDEQSNRQQPDSYE